MNKVEGRTFRNELIDLDFSDWEKCNFINCTIHTTYGIFKLKNNDFSKCKLSLDGPAETLARLLHIFFEDKPIFFESKKEGKL